MGLGNIVFVYVIHDVNSVAGCCESDNEQWGSSCSRRQAGRQAGRQLTH